MATYHTMAQDVKTDTIDLEPYRTVVFNTAQTKSAVKRQVYIQRLNKERGLYNDTISIELKDKNGQRQTYIMFNKGKRENPVNYTYLKRDKHTGFTTVGKEYNEDVRRIVDTLFNKDNTVASVSTKVVRKAHTTIHTVYTYTYNALKQPTSRKYYMSTNLEKKPRLLNHHNFIYEGKLLKRVEAILNPYLKNIFYETLYTYNPDTSLAKKERFEVRNGNRTLLEFNDYTYTNKLLTQELYGSYSRDKDVTKVEYEYNAHKQLSKLKTSKDTLYKNIQYTYVGNKLKNIHWETNARTGLSREHFAPIFTYSERRMPIIYDAEYYHDAEGNFLGVKHSLFGELRTHFEYLQDFFEPTK
ncbi:hypothetical protein [Mucilaginibacter terrae]|nr:hypothetical protein [Mucilaginibacter terrae]